MGGSVVETAVEAGLLGVSTGSCTCGNTVLGKKELAWIVTVADYARA
jgi:hypothetical protein